MLWDDAVCLVHVILLGRVRGKFEVVLRDLHKYLYVQMSVLCTNNLTLRALINLYMCARVRVCVCKERL